MSGKPVPGKVTATVKEEALGATTYTLSNGVKVTIKPTEFKSDEILMTGIKKGGSNSYGIADRNNVLLATDVVDAMGVGAFTPSDLEKVMAGKNVKVKEKISEINVQLNCSSTVKDFESMLQLTYLTIMSPRKDDGLFNAYKEKQKTMLAFMTSNPQFAFFDTSVKALYNGNPLARRIIPKPEDFDDINLDRSLEIYKSEVGTADGYHFFIVGNVKPEQALPLIETYLGSIPSRGATAAFRDNGVRPAKGTTEIKIRRGKEQKSMIFAIYSGELPYSEDLALKTQAVAEILNIKVIEDLREKMGKIYGGGFYGSLSKDPYERFSIALQLPCGPESVDTLLKASDLEIKMLIAKGPKLRMLIR